MKKTLSVLLLSFFAVTWAYAQQTPRVLTPAEQKQKDKIDREIQRERQIRAEWLQKQREYEAKQAEKERQRQAKKAGKELPPAVAPKPAVAAPTTTAPVTQPTVSQPVTTAPVVTGSTEKERREQQKKEEQAAREAKEAQQKADKQAAKEAKAAQQKAEKQAAREAKEAQQKANQPTRAAVTPPVTESPAVVPTPVETKVKAEQPKREKKPVGERTDSIALASGGAEPTLARPRKEFLPKGHLFDPILLDPLEAQTYGSILPGYWTDGQKYKGSIVPFAFGFAKPFYRRSTGSDRAEEWVLDLASFTQFEAYHDDVMDKARRQIINTDYKISIIYNIRRGENNYRIRVYHISSHLGDDYIYRNKLTAPSPNSVNYEQLDFTYSRNVMNWRLYGGAGIVLRKTEERKLFSAQLGAFYKKPSTHAARLVGGADIKFWQQTDFRPGIHGGIGIELGRTQNNLTFLLEGYSGFRPYSQYEQQQTSWIGVGLYLNPF